MRRLLSWLPAVLLVPAVMAGAVAVSAPDDPTAAMRALQPLDVGTTWVYQVTDHGKPSGTRTRQVAGQAGIGDDLLDSVALTSAYTDYPGVGVSESTAYLGLTGRRLLQYGVYSDHEYQKIDPPAPAYELPAEPGRTWSYDGKIGETSLAYDVRLVDVGDAEAGGRTFHDCAHYVTDYTWTFGESTSTETYEEWTCPDIGPVRSVDTSTDLGLDMAEELVEFHGRDGNWWATPPDAVEVEAVPGSTLGTDPGRSRALADGRVEPALAWSESRNTAVTFPPVGDDRVRVLAETDGTVSATDAGSGEVRWRVRLAGPVVTTPAMAGAAVVVADADKNVWALDAASGAARWVRRLGDVVSASPAVGTSTAVLTTEDGAVTALDLATGDTAWRTDLGEPAYGAAALADDRVVVVGRSGTLTALDLADGHPAWSHGLEGAPVSSPTITDGTVLTADDSKVLYAWDLADGGLRWEATTDHTPASDLAAGSGRVVLRTGGDHLEAYGLDDGDHTWTTTTPPSRLAPVIVGDQVVGVSVSGAVEARDLADGDRAASWRLPTPTPGSSVDVDVPLALLGHDLVVGGEVAAEGQQTTFFAYPIDPAARRHGLVFATDVRPVPSSPAAAPVLAGDALLQAGQDHVLYRDDEPLVRSDGLLPGVVLDGDLAITQRGDEWQAVPVTGGDPAWTFPATDPMPGSLPGVSGDTVFLPIHGLGLAAVDAATGDTTWYRPLPGDVGATTPLVLPGGDVVYASGSLVRYDGLTGRPRWSVPDLAAFSAPAYDDGVVYVDAVRNDHPSGLAAYDAATGRRLWFHPNQDTAIVAGPGVGEGVVVYASSRGLVTALDDRTGAELWHVRLRTPVAGVPVVSDGRVLLAETGREEDLYQRDYRVSAHDLHTGVLLGAFEPPGPGYVKVPSVGHTPDGRLLVPATSRLGTIVMVLEATP